MRYRNWSFREKGLPGAGGCPPAFLSCEEDQCSRSAPYEVRKMALGIAEAKIRAKECFYRQVLMYRGRKTLLPSTLSCFVYKTYSVPIRLSNLVLNLLRDMGEYRLPDLTSMGLTRGFMAASGKGRTIRKFTPF